jgi:hypothetical protein
MKKQKSAGSNLDEIIQQFVYGDRLEDCEGFDFLGTTNTFESNIW